MTIFGLMFYHLVRGLRYCYLAKQQAKSYIYTNILFSKDMSVQQSVDTVTVKCENESEHSIPIIRRS
jgi:hypothetical protein